MFKVLSIANECFARVVMFDDDEQTVGYQLNARRTDDNGDYVCSFSSQNL